MTEHQIFKYLNPESNCNFEFKRLIPSEVEKLSTVLSKTIYEDVKSTSATKARRCSDAIELLTKWCSTNAHGHTRIKDSNYSVFVENLLAVRERNEDNAFAAFRKKVKEQKPFKDEWDEICEFYEERNRKIDERKKRLDLLAALDVKPESVFMKAVLATLPRFNKNKVEYLKSLKQEEPKLSNTVKQNNENHIALGYAILNFDCNDYNYKLLTDIIHGLSNKQDLATYETEFLTYITENVLYGDLSVLIYETFPFIYEKKLLNVATQSLMSREVDLSGLKNIYLLSPKIANNFKRILYEILSLSGYDVRIFELIKSITFP